MAAPPAGQHKLLAEYLASQSRKELLRFITCGSVDDGKSTLIGRLLYEARALFEDQLSALEADSKRVGTQGGALDFALLVDGLSAEREQGITIDVAYRFFATERRKYIVADTPGHEQYTRNMVTGASTADLAVILIDARKGVLTQTRRHSYLVNLIGIRRIVLAINKMDLVGFDQQVFERIESEYRAFAGEIGITDITAIPVSALLGENVVDPGPSMSWYRGPTLLGHLDTVPLGESQAQTQPFRMSVQWVCRPNQEFRGFAGQVAAGTVRPGDELVALPSGRRSHVTRIVTAGGDLAEAVAGQAVVLTLADEIDASRGELLAAAGAPAEVADVFDATVVWMSDDAMLTGRPYLLKCGTTTVSAQMVRLEYKTNVNTLERQGATELGLNEIGTGQLRLDHPLPFDPYSTNRDTGGFILIDRITHNTVGAGILHAGRRHSENVHWQALDINKENRSAQKGQRACVLWFTGLSGAGKSTIANLVEKQLFRQGRHTYLLDGDNVRHGLNADLGFTTSDRVENIRRVGEVARLMSDAGLIVLVSFISPFRAERAMARALLPAGEFFEIFVDTELAEAEQRDPKGLYRKARAGELRNFTGIDSPYEPPDAPEIHIRTAELAPVQAAERIVAALRAAGMIDREGVFLP